MQIVFVGCRSVRVTTDARHDVNEVVVLGTEIDLKKMALTKPKTVEFTPMPTARREHSDESKARILQRHPNAKPEVSQEGVQIRTSISVTVIVLRNEKSIGVRAESRLRLSASMVLLLLFCSKAHLLKEISARRNYRC